MYINDIFIIWPHGMDISETFLEDASRTHPNISLMSMSFECRLLCDCMPIIMRLDGVKLEALITTWS